MRDKYGMVMSDKELSHQYVFHGTCSSLNQADLSSQPENCLTLPETLSADQVLNHLLLAFFQDIHLPYDHIWHN